MKLATTRANSMKPQRLLLMHLMLRLTSAIMQHLSEKMGSGQGQAHCQCARFQSSPHTCQANGPFGPSYAARPAVESWHASQAWQNRWHHTAYWLRCAGISEQRHTEQAAQVEVLRFLESGTVLFAFTGFGTCQPEVQIAGSENDLKVVARIVLEG